MNILDLLKDDFARETATTRKHLERLPADRFAWRPHPKSSTAGDLASHLVDCTRYTAMVSSTDGLDIDPASFKPWSASSPDELLAEYDRVVADGKQALDALTDETSTKPWRFSIMQKTRFERPRVLVLRDFSLNHLIHHRGQFSVYLRLMDVPVPGTYGPTADERF